MAWLSPDDLTRWQHGTAFDSYRHLGAHVLPGGGVQFTVWAPHAEYVWVIGDFNGWQTGAHRLEWREGGLWTGTVAEARAGQHYKFRVKRGGYQADKSDPYAFAMEAPSQGGNPIAGLSGIVTDLTYDWRDGDWMRQRPDAESALKRPMSIYEVHLGSWKRKPDGSVHSYREIAEPLADHVAGLGFTHVELMPVLEHPYYGSWGYQVVGYYAPTHRYGSPQDFMHLVDTLHQRGIGVLLDWVPAHFATDPQGLVFFDGSTLFEYDDPSMRAHPDWGTYVFDYAKPGVQNFLVSNALFWLDKYHLDGLRFDAVASMLYRDYSRQEWTPNQYGGRENLEAIHLLKTVNEQVYSRFPSAMTIAEESTSWPGVSAPTFNGGLGFGGKWNMGWMHDTLEYFSKDPVLRKYQHNNLTFPLMYAFSEHFVLPLSHDEVVHLKGSLWEKMPGDDWQKAANLRLLFTHMVGHPGKLLLFMGAEFGQTTEWNHDIELPWAQASEPLHGSLTAWLHDLLHLYREHPALHDDSDAGFQWIDFGDREQSVVSYIRRGADADGVMRTLVFVLNMTPVPRGGYRVGVPQGGAWRVVLGSDGEQYGGGGISTHGQFQALGVGASGQPDALALDLPPLGALVLERVDDAHRDG